MTLWLIPTQDHTGFTQDSTGFHRIFFHKIPQDSTGLILLDKRPYSRSTGLCGGEKSCGFQNCQNILLFNFFFWNDIPVESCGIFCLFHKIAQETWLPQNVPKPSPKWKKGPQKTWYYFRDFLGTFFSNNLTDFTKNIFGDDFSFWGLFGEEICFKFFNQSKVQIL